MKHQRAIGMARPSRGDCRGTSSTAHLELVVTSGEHADIPSRDAGKRIESAREMGKEHSIPISSPVEDCRQKESN